SDGGSIPKMPSRTKSRVERASRRGDSAGRRRPETIGKGSNRTVAQSSVQKFSTAAFMWSEAILYAGFCAAHSRLTTTSVAMFTYRVFSQGAVFVRQESAKWSSTRHCRAGLRQPPG